MGPRSKQKRDELLLCDICGCMFMLKDSACHNAACSTDRPLTHHFEQSAHDVIFKCDQKQTYGLVFGDVLYAKVEEIKDKELPDNLPKCLKGRVIQLNPTVMKHLQMSIGRPVVINSVHVYTVWPCTQVPATSVRMTKDVINEIDIHEDTVMIQMIQGSIVEAYTLKCSIRNFSELCKKYKDISTFIILNSVDRLVTCGSHLTMDVYGQVCKILVDQIQGTDHQGSAVSNNSSVPIIMDSIVDRVKDLEITEVTNFNEDTASPSSRSLENLRNAVRFYRICLSTKLIVNNDDDMKDVASTWPTLKDFGGFHKQIEEIRSAISSYLFKSEFFRSQGISTPGGILLYGPSGSGKTMLVQALSREFPVHFVTINGADIWSKYYGESEAKLSSTLMEVLEQAPAIVFLDEVDSLCPRRESAKNEVERRVVAALLTLLDKMAASDKQVFIIGATNRRQDIDRAMRRPGRLDREVEIGVPHAADRIEILQKLLHRTKHDLEKGVITDIGERAHGFLGADLAAVCKEAMLQALKTCRSDDVILSAGDLRHGFQMVKPSAMKEVTLEVAKVSWSDIGGQEELKHKLRQAVEWPLKHPEAFSRLGIRPPRGLLMYGPPGCSKTMIAKALARESGLNFIAIKGPELFSKWVGESERAVREVFHRARAAAPAIVFFDEIDALAGERGSHGGGGGDVADRVLAQLLTEMDGVQALEDILVVAATNRPDRIDKALMRPGRLDRIVYVPLPDDATRHAIFSINFKKMPTTADVDINNLVELTDGYSGAEVAAVCNEAALAALQSDIDCQKVEMRHFLEALTAIKPRITPELIAIYDEYRARGSAVS